MSFKSPQTTNLPSKTMGFDSVATPWVRNPTWLTLPTLSASDQRVVGLFAVYPESNFVAFTAFVSSGNYVVDWGDSTSDDTLTSGSTAQHQFSYTDAALNGTDGPVTFTDSGDTVNRTAHGYTDGMTISFATVVTTTGISAGQTYYVVNATANTFQLAATLGGSPIALTTDGTGTILPYKQVIVSITPQTGTFTSSINFNVKNTTSGLQNYAPTWLDMTFASGSSGGFTQIFIGNSPANINSRQLERVTILCAGLTDCSYMFSNCTSLKSVPLFNAASVTSFNSTFDNCSQLEEIPALVTTSATNMTTMFNNCSMLINVPTMNTASVTNMSSMFSGCSRLKRAPFFNTAAVTNASSMFNSCTDLIEVPGYNFAAVTNGSSMFATCRALARLPKMTFTAAQNLDSLFQNCNSLVECPQLGTTTALTSCASMFASCFSLVEVPLFTTTNVTSMNSMFSGCQSLVTVPLFSTTNVTNMSSMFTGCYSLRSVPLFDTANVTNMSTMFNNCRVLNTVPFFNTVKVTNFSTMFNSCQNLEFVPAFDTTATTGTTAFTQMFNGCTKLSVFPAMNLGRAAISGSGSYTSIVGGCVNLGQMTPSTGPKLTFTVASCKLSGAALDALYTSLPSVTSQTITVSNNWGTATDTPTIATAKGWTVTGS